VHAFVNDLERPIDTYRYGRRMYDVMVFRETAQSVHRFDSGVVHLHYRTTNAG